MGERALIGPGLPGGPARHAPAAGEGSPGGRAVSAAVEDSAKNAHAELERVDRDTFVYAVEHAEEVQVSRHAQGREPEAADPERAERLRIRTGGQAIRDDLG